MSFFAASLASQIRAARAALHRAGIENRTASEVGHPLWLAANRAADCLADLERAQRLLDSERSSAEAAERALDRAAQLFEIEQQQQRRAEENQQDTEEREALAAAGIDQAAEAERLRKTLALASAAIREAATLRSSTQPGETAGDTQERWNNAHAIETAATACRKAARKALAALTVFADKRSPEQIAAAIEAARTEALALKHAIDLEQRDNAQRQIRLAAREAARIAADCAAIEAGKAAKAARKKGGAL